MIYQVKVENKDYYCFVNQLRTKGCLQKKNSIWRDIVPTSHYPLPPFKSRDKNRRDIFWVLDPPPPLQK